MSGAPRKEIPRPKGDDDFEDLARALFHAVWQDPSAKLNGRRGQRQHGVDLYGEDRSGNLIGVQCKQHGSATSLKDVDLLKKLREEVEDAKGFKPPLRRFIFATTAKRSTVLQEAARTLTERHKEEGLFAVDVLGWDDFEDLLRGHEDVLAWYLDERTKDHTPRLAIGRLPIPGPLLIGRKAELDRLDAAWKDPAVHLLVLVAFGGMGKSALVSHWMDGMAAAGWPGARRVFDWSFYSQGTEERVTSAERFFDEALSFFGDPDPKAGAPRDRGLRLAELIRREKTLLVLDGVEPLQHPPNSALAGRLKDPGLAALLKSLAGGNPGLCVVTTRERITDLDASPKTAPQEDLEALSSQAGAELLRQLGVVGKDSELLSASEELRDHALAVTLLGGYLTKAKGGDVRRRKDIDLAGADAKKGGHALRVIGAYARWLGEGPELSVLRLIGLFDRPASPKALAALRAEPAIPGLTDSLRGTAEEDWKLGRLDPPRTRSPPAHRSQTAGDPGRPSPGAGLLPGRPGNEPPRSLEGGQPAALRAPPEGGSRPARHPGRNGAALHCRPPRLPGGTPVGNVR